jgi:hypothetical protein
MALKPTNKLPAPPPDLAKRPLPLKRVQGAIFRIHRKNQPCLHFGKNISERFDDPLGNYGVLYGAMRPEASFAEVFLRRLSLMLVQESDLIERCLSRIECRALRCVDLTGAGLRKVSCDNRITTEKPYHTVGLWSQAFFEHPLKPHGILYRSRHNPRFVCLALFDHCQANLTLRLTESLMAEPRRKWTINQIAKYNLAIEPM